MQKRLTVILILLIIAPLLSPLPAGQAAEYRINTITPKTLNWWIEYGESFTLINVGSYLECMDTKIPRSICISCDETEKTTINLPARKDAKIVFYDGTGGINSKCALIDTISRQGYNQLYMLQGGLPAWKLAGYETESQERIPRVFIPAIKAKDIGYWIRTAKNPLLLDIRSPRAFSERHIDGAMNLPLSLLHKGYQNIPLNRALLVVDEDGTKSLLAASYLARKGFRDLKRLQGGMNAWTKMMEKDRK